MRFDDPFAGTAELRQLIKKAKPHLSRGQRGLRQRDRWHHVDGRARGPDRPGRRASTSGPRTGSVGRPTARRMSRKTDPYQEGEVCWLDEAPEGR